MEEGKGLKLCGILSVKEIPVCTFETSITSLIIVFHKFCKDIIIDILSKDVWFLLGSCKGYAHGFLIKSPTCHLWVACREVVIVFPESSDILKKQVATKQIVKSNYIFAVGPHQFHEYLVGIVRIAYVTCCVLHLPFLNIRLHGMLVSIQYLSGKRTIYQRLVKNS